MHYSLDLIRLFKHCFETSHQTQLKAGGAEPIYQPATASDPWHRLYFAHGFFSSALHECAHWLIAGHKRRQQLDFGYWYEPDGRNNHQQQLFLQVEIKPQAMEWILAKAAAFPFRVSIDNLEGEPADLYEFKNAVHQAVLNYCEQGLPPRAKVFREALCQFYGTSMRFVPQDFDRLSLDRFHGA